MENIDSLCVFSRCNLALQSCNEHKLLAREVSVQNACEGAPLESESVTGQPIFCLEEDFFKPREKFFFHLLRL